MRSGYWKFHRKMWDWPWANNPSYLVVWCWLLSEAQYQDGKSVLFHGKRINLKSGQLTCGSIQISKATGVPSSTVRRIIKCLRSEQQIEHQKDNKKSMITISKWKDYQSDERQSEQQMSSKRAADEQQVSITEEVNNKRIKEVREGDKLSTPNQQAKDFFKNEQNQFIVVDQMVKTGKYRSDLLLAELPKFISYWTEPLKNGRGQRWEAEKAFEVVRRLATWVGRAKTPAFHAPRQDFARTGGMTKAFQTCGKCVGGMRDGRVCSCVRPLHQS